MIDGSNVVVVLVATISQLVTVTALIRSLSCLECILYRENDSRDYCRSQASLYFFFL